MLGIPFERTLKFHRWLGVALVLLCGVHVLLACLQWTRAEPPIDPVAQIRDDPDYTYGAAAAATVVVILLTAVPWMRRHAFNVFVVSHFLFLAFYVLACLHQPAYDARHRPTSYLLSMPAGMADSEGLGTRFAAGARVASFPMPALQEFCTCWIASSGERAACCLSAPRPGSSGAPSRLRASASQGKLLHGSERRPK